MYAEKDDALYTLLKGMELKLARYGGKDLEVHLDGGVLRIFFPFAAGAVYGIATTLEDLKEDLDIGLDIHIFKCLEGELRIRIAIEPSERSWIWKRCSGLNKIFLGDLGAYYAAEIAVGEAKKEVLRRITV